MRVNRTGVRTMIAAIEQVFDVALGNDFGCLAQRSTVALGMHQAFELGRRTN
jgi:hypothetical protein